jgi:hypothetical protein
MHQQQNMCSGKSGKVFAIGKNNFVFLITLSFLRVLEGSRRVFMKGEMMKSEKSEYDLYSAVTFLLIGLGLGAVFGMVFNPKTKQRVRLQGINSRRPQGVQLQEEASGVRFGVRT